MFFFYIIDTWSRDFNIDFTLNIYLFRSVKLTKNVDPDKYKCSGYNTGFDFHSEFSLTDGGVGKNVIIFAYCVYLCIKIIKIKKSQFFVKEWHKD